MSIVVIPVDSDHSEEATVVNLMSPEDFDILAATSLDADCLLSERILVYSNQVFVL